MKDTEIKYIKAKLQLVARARVLGVEYEDDLSLEEKLEIAQLGKLIEITQYHLDSLKELNTKLDGILGAKKA